MIFDDVEITNRQDLFFTCDCSREKMINALSTIGKQELQSIIPITKAINFFLFSIFSPLKNHIFQCDYKRFIKFCNSSSLS